VDLDEQQDDVLNAMGRTEVGSPLAHAVDVRAELDQHLGGAWSHMMLDETASQDP